MEEHEAHLRAAGVSDERALVQLPPSRLAQVLKGLRIGQRNRVLKWHGRRTKSRDSRRGAREL